MAVLARCIEFEIDDPRAIAASAIAPPMTARIRAYSAAEAAWVSEKSLFIRNCQASRTRLAVSLYLQAADPGVVMQFFARPIELETAPPKAMAASAMAPPTIARIRAYSAAEAPDWSFSMLMNVFTMNSFD